MGASSKAWRKRSRLCIASARASSLSRQCTTLTTPSAAMKSAWMPAQRHGWATASGWLKTEAGSSAPMSPWWPRTKAKASR